MAIVGLRNLVYAKLLTDSKTGKATYSSVKPFAAAINAKVDTAQDTATNYADNRPVSVMTQIGETKLGLTTADLTQEVAADILGQELKKGVIAYKQTAVGPYVAVGFCGDKDDGTERVVWLTKGRFSIPSDDWKSKTDKPDFTNADIEGTFIGRDSDEVFKIVGDTADLTFAPFRAAFFDDVFDLSKLDTPTP